MRNARSCQGSAAGNCYEKRDDPGKGHNFHRCLGRRQANGLRGAGSTHSDPGKKACRSAAEDQTRRRH